MSLAKVGSVLDEENLPVDVSKRGRICNVCGVTYKGHMKRHVIDAHLPWYTDPTEACWEGGCYVGKMSRHLEISMRVHSSNPGFLTCNIPSGINLHSVFFFFQTLLVWILFMCC